LAGVATLDGLSLAARVSAAGARRIGHGTVLAETGPTSGQPVAPESEAPGSVASGDQCGTWPGEAGPARDGVVRYMSSTSNSRADELTARADELEEELDRYVRAVEELMQQLDWCISYMQRSGERGIARSLAKNRTLVRRTLAQPRPGRSRRR
jgi:hypothetical protein